jgi:hypothetical protein
MVLSMRHSFSKLEVQWTVWYNVWPLMDANCNLLGYRRHHSIYYTRLFTTPLVVITISLFQWVLTLWYLPRSGPLISSSSICWQLTDWLTLFMSLLKSGLCIRNRIHLVARFTFPVLALLWIPTIWLERRRVFIFGNMLILSLATHCSGNVLSSSVA